MKVHSAKAGKKKIEMFNEAAKSHLQETGLNPVLSRDHYRTEPAEPDVHAGLQTWRTGTRDGRFPDVPD